MSIPEDHVFGKYQLIAELGHGGMADVFLAVAQGPVGFNKLVVVKRLRDNLVDEPEYVAMLLDEARLAARLNHPNVVQTNEVGQVGKQYFIAMEYLDGQALNRIKHRASRKSALTLAHDVRILCDVLAGLHHAHELADFDGSPLQVVHRDVSPHNVFITYAGQVKVVDFGIAKAAGRSQETNVGVVKGKVTYMAPEQALGISVDRRADIFAVGVMLWEAATGARMWNGLQELVVVSRLMSGDIPSSPRAVKADVPERIDAICRKALAKNPEDRHATAAELQTDLEAWLAEEKAHVGPRELGAIVSELFADRRAEMKELIDKQLVALRSSKVDVVPVNADPLSSSHSSLKTLRTAVSVVEQASVAPGSEALVSGRAPAKDSAAKRGALAAGVLGIAAVIAVAALRRPPPAPPADAASAVPTAAPTPSPTSAAKTEERVTITLRAHPPDATFRIDDGAPVDNPAILTFPKDDKSHVIRIESPGYKSETRAIRFAQDLVVDVTLLEDKPSDAKHAAPRVISRPVAPAQPAGKPKRPIDTADPW